LDAADEALANVGFKRMRIEDLARAAGIAKGTVYLSFPSKKEIALACIDRMAGQVLARMKAIAASNGPVPARLRKALVERVLARFDYARTHSASVDETSPRSAPRCSPAARRTSRKRPACLHPSCTARARSTPPAP
jgi:AcrR family transcriptional regulator